MSQRSSRLNSINMPEADRFALILREAKFQEYFIDILKEETKSLKDVVLLIEVATLINSFSNYTERDFERANGYNVIQ